MSYIKKRWHMYLLSLPIKCSLRVLIARPRITFFSFIPYFFFFLLGYGDVYYKLTKKYKIWKNKKKHTNNTQFKKINSLHNTQKKFLKKKKIIFTTKGYFNGKKIHTYKMGKEWALCLTFEKIKNKYNSCTTIFKPITTTMSNTEYLLRITTTMRASFSKYIWKKIWMMFL